MPTSAPEQLQEAPRWILEGLLAADLIGFHEYAYLYHFCSSALKVLGLESSCLSVQRGKKTTQLGVFPVAVDTAAIHSEALPKREFQFLGVDRLDDIKGIDLKL